MGKSLNFAHMVWVLISYYSGMGAMRLQEPLLCKQQLNAPWRSDIKQIIRNNYDSNTEWNGKHHCAAVLIYSAPYSLTIVQLWSSDLNQYRKNGKLVTRMLRSVERLLCEEWLHRVWKKGVRGNVTEVCKTTLTGERVNSNIFFYHHT